MSIIDQVRDHFKDHPGERFDNAGLRDELDIDDSAHISMALNALHNAGELKREKKDGHGFDYWLASGASPAPRALSPKDVAAKLVKQRTAAKPAKAPKEKKAKVAKVKKARVAKAKKTYQKKTKPAHVAAVGGGRSGSGFAGRLCRFRDTPRRRARHPQRRHRGEPAASRRAAA